jgi:hypothetical protein
MKKLPERRKYKRFQAADGALAVLRPSWPHSATIGQIIDISRGGLAIRYIAGEERSNDSSKLSIVFADHSFYLPKVPTKTISDLEIARMPFISMTPRRRSLQFDGLTRHQVSELEYFIQNHTTDKA